MHRVVGAYRERLQQRHAHQPERAALKALTVAVDALTATLETRVAALKRTDAATLACAESLWLRGDRLAVEMASNGKSDDVEEMKELLERARRFWPGEFREQKIALVNNIVLAIALAEERFGVGEIARFIEEMVSENVVQVEDVRDVESAQMVFFMYGICLLENDDVSKCRMFVNDLDDCLELNRNLPLLSLLYVLVMYFSREYDMARSLIRSLHFSNAMTFRYLKAFLLFEGKEFEESIKIILEEGDSPKYLAFQDFTLLSAAYSSTGSIEKATQSLQESIRKSITSKTIQGAYNTGTHAFLNGRWEQCITAYSIVLKNVEQMSSGLDIRHGVGKRFALEHSLENSNDCVDAATIYRCLSIAYYNAGKITLSLDHLRLMDEQLGIESSSLLCFYLEVSIQSKEYQLALGLCERILHLNPSCLEVAMDKAHVLFNLKDIKGCLEQCRLAIKSIETGRIREITQTNLESDPVAENLQEPSPKKSKTETLRDEMIVISLFNLNPPICSNCLFFNFKFFR